MLFTILILAIAVVAVALLVSGVQKAKAEKKGIYADEAKCPYHGEEIPVGYETAAPAPAEKPKKKAAAKKAPAKKVTAKAPAKAKTTSKKK